MIIHICGMERSIELGTVQCRPVVYQDINIGSKVITRFVFENAFYYSGLSHYDFKLFLVNVCFKTIHSKLSSVLLLCLLRIFMKQTL